MSAFYENFRNVLSEVDKFIESLKNEKLSKKVQTGRDKVVEAIKKLRQEFPALESQSDLKVPDNDTDHVSNESIKTKSSHGSGNAEEDEGVYSENVPEKSVRELVDPTKAGYLDKRRKKPALLQSAYQKRFCVVKDRFFYYFERNTDKKQAGAFSLEGYEFKEAPQYVQGKDINKKLCFELTSPGKRPFQGKATEEVNDLVFLVDSKEEFHAWQEAITGVSSGSAGDIPIEGELEDIYEEMEEVAEKAKALALSEQKPQEVKTDDQEVYDDAAAAVEGELDEIYDDVDNVDRSQVTSPPEPAVIPPPVPPPLKKPVMPLPDLPPPDLPPPGSLPPTIQNQPLPDLPPPPPEVVPARPKFQMTENPDEDYENMYYGKWDCKADGADELSFKHGDIIHVINKEFDSKEWWVGRLNEKYGLVPKKYLILAYKAV